MHLTADFVWLIASFYNKIHSFSYRPKFKPNLYEDTKMDVHIKWMCFFFRFYFSHNVLCVIYHTYHLNTELWYSIGSQDRVLKSLCTTRMECPIVRRDFRQGFPIILYRHTSSIENIDRVSFEKPISSKLVKII